MPSDILHSFDHARIDDSYLQKPFWISEGFGLYKQSNRRGKSCQETTAEYGLLGEVTPRMAEAVGDSDAVRILLPSQKCPIILAIGPRQNDLNEVISLQREELQRLTAN